MDPISVKLQLYDGLTLSGGGSKGIIMLGILHYCVENKRINLNEINFFSGTSVGAVISLLLVCGYSPIEIYQKLSTMENFFVENSNYAAANSSFKNKTDHLGSYKKNDMNSKMTGIMQSDGLQNIIASLVTKKLGVTKTPTFLELFHRTGKGLYMSGTNTTTKSEEIFSHITHPNLDCVEGAVMSSLIPIMFKAKEYENNIIADGGIVNNLPWDYISDSSNKILAILLGTASIQFPEDSALGYLYNLIMTPVTRLTQLRKEIAPNNVEIIECVWECGMLQMVLTKEQKWKMFLFGYHTAERFYNSDLIFVDGWKSMAVRRNIYKKKPGDGWEFGDD